MPRKRCMKEVIKIYGIYILHQGELSIVEIKMDFADAQKLKNEWNKESGQVYKVIPLSATPLK